MHLKMTVGTSVAQLAIKWPEMVVKWPFQKVVSFLTEQTLCTLYTYHCPESNMYYIPFFSNLPFAQHAKCCHSWPQEMLHICASGRRYILHNITLLYEHLCKKQVMTPSIVHTYIDWFLPLQNLETHFNGQKNRSLVLYFLYHFWLMFNSALIQILPANTKRKDLFNFSLEFLVHIYRNVTR